MLQITKIRMLTLPILFKILKVRKINEKIKVGTPNKLCIKYNLLNIGKKKSPNQLFDEWTREKNFKINNQQNLLYEAMGSPQKLSLGGM